MVAQYNTPSARPTFKKTCMQITFFLPPTLQSHLKSTNEWKQNNDLFRRKGPAQWLVCSRSCTLLAGSEDFFQSKLLSLLAVSRNLDQKKFKKVREKTWMACKIINESKRRVSWCISGFCFSRTGNLSHSISSQGKTKSSLFTQASRSVTHAHARTHAHTPLRELLFN